MSERASSTFIYVSYIRTTPERLWEALTTPEFMRQYWFGMHLETDWAQGAPWRLVFPDGRTADMGEVAEVKPSRLLVLHWRNEHSATMKEEGTSVCTMEIEQANGAVKLTVTHSIDRPDSCLIRGVSGGWPMIICNLKSLLETGDIAVRRET